MKSFLWNKECRVVTLFSQEFSEKPVLSAKLPDVRSVYVDPLSMQTNQVRTDNAQIIVLGQEGDLDLAIDLSTSLYTPTVHLMPSSSEDDGSYSDILV